MPAPLKDALSSIADRFAPVESESQGSTYTRIPDHVMLGVGVPDCLKTFVGALVKLGKGKNRFRVSDKVIAAKLGKSPKSINALFRMGERFGFVLRLGKTLCREVLLLFTFRAGAEKPPLPFSAPEGRSPRAGTGTSPSKRGDFSALARSPIEEENKKTLEKASAEPSPSASPQGATPTARPTEREDTPPVPPPPPSPTVQPETDWKALRAEFEAAPESIRSEIHAETLAENPALALIPSMLEKLCLVRFEKRPQIASDPSPALPVPIVQPTVEVLSDAELGTLPSLAFAEDPIMRSIATAELHRLGRADVLLRPMAEKSREARRPKVETLASRKRRNR
jgi:hypothetical protein